MRRSSLATLRCPACRQALVLEAAEDGSDLTYGNLRCACGRSYAIENGILNLSYPTQLLPSDEEFKQKYNEGAEKYDAGLDWLFASFYENEGEVRGVMLDLLELRPNARVLEVGCGTGKDSFHISAHLNETGELYVQDISSGMLQIAKRRLAESVAPVEYFLGNAAYLPFDDGYFDCAFHFGGLNTFGELEKSLAEITRVVRVGGRVVVGDEGVAPWLREKTFGRVLMNANPLYEHTPPLQYLPETARDVRLRWILHNAFYVIDYSVDSGPPKVDLDLPIPGKGDSLRSRYEQRFGTKIQD